MRDLFHREPQADRLLAGQDHVFTKRVVDVCEAAIGVEQGHAIGHGVEDLARQPVGVRKFVARLAEFGLPLLQVGDVAADAERAPVGQGAEHDLAVPAVGERTLEAAALRGEDARHPLVDRQRLAVDDRDVARGFSRLQDILAPHADRHRPDAQEILRRVVDVLDPAIGIEQGDPVRHAVAHGSHQSLQGGELFARRPKLGLQRGGIDESPGGAGRISGVGHGSIPTPPCVSGS